MTAGAGMSQSPRRAMAGGDLILCHYRGEPAGHTNLSVRDQASVYHSDRSQP